MEYLKDDRYEGTNMAYKCKIFDAVNLSLYGYYCFVYIHMCTVSKDSSINKEKEICPQTRNPQVVYELQ